MLIIRARCRRAWQKSRMASTRRLAGGSMRAETAVKMDDAPLLNVRGVSVHYDGAISALENIDFCVSEKALVALLGANGAGKTTLMKAIAGMLPFERGEVTAGTITMRSEERRVGT